MTAERITPGMLASTTLLDLNRSLTALNRTAEEMSSGKTILEPSDNPYGASQVIHLQSQMDGLSAYAANTHEAISWENSASGALASMSSVVQRVRELVLQATSGTASPSALKAIGIEVGQLTETIKQDANTQYAGQYVFAGTATTTAPYKSGEEDAYQGNSGTVTRAIGPSSSVVVSSNISALLGSGKGAADGKLLDTLRTITEHLNGGGAEEVKALDGPDLEHLDANIETLSELQATAGSVTDQLQMASTRIEGLQSSLTANLSNVEDANIAQVAIAYSTEQAGYQAALRSGATILQESLLNFLH